MPAELDLAALVGRPGPLHTGAPEVAGRHGEPGRIWPAVILLGRGMRCDRRFEPVDVRLEMTPDEARELGKKLLVMAARIG